MDEAVNKKGKNAHAEGEQQYADDSHASKIVFSCFSYLCCMDRDSILLILRAHKAEIQKKYPVASLALFGSFARGEQKPESDVDLLVEFNGPIGLEVVDLVEYLETLLNVKRVDLVSKKYVKPHYRSYIERDLIHV